MQTSEGTASFPATDVRTVGTDYVNFNVPDSDREFLTDIETGDSFVLALTRPAPQPTVTPTDTPTPQPTVTPTDTPTPQPTVTPTDTPTPQPTATEPLGTTATPMPEQLTDQVTALNMTSDTPGKLTVTWQAPTTRPDDYRVSWAKTAEDYPSWRDTDGNSYPTCGALTITGLEHGAEYKVRVRPRFDQSGSPWSGPWTEGRQTVSSPIETQDESEATPTPEATPIPAPMPTPQTDTDISVSGLSVTLSENGQIAVSWNTREPYPNFYHVEWASVQDDYTDGLDNNTDRYVFEGTSLVMDSPGAGSYKFRIRMKVCPEDMLCQFGPWSDNVVSVLELTPKTSDVQIATKSPNEVVSDIIGVPRYNSAVAGARAREALSTLGQASQGTSGKADTNSNGPRDVETPTPTPTHSWWRPNDTRDNPASGHYQKRSSIQYVWWIRYEVKTHKFNPSGGTAPYECNQDGWNEVFEYQVEITSKMQFFYDGELQDTENGVTGFRKSSNDVYHNDLLWNRPARETEFLDARKMSFRFPIESIRGNGYCRIAAYGWVPVKWDGRWVQVQKLSAMRHRYQRYTDANGPVTSIGWHSVDPIFIAPETTYTGWRRTYNGVESIAVTSTPANDLTYVTGEKITLKVKYNAAIPATTVTLPLKIGNRTEYLESTSTSTREEFDFEYTALATDRDDNGVSVDRNTVTTSLPVNLVRNFNPKYEAGLSHAVNGAPVITGLNFTSRPLPLARDSNDHRYATGDEMEITVTFNQPVLASGDPELEVKTFNDRYHTELFKIPHGNVGTNIFTYSGRGTEAEEIVFSYTVGERDAGQYMFVNNGRRAFRLDADDSITDAWRSSDARLDAELGHRVGGIFRNHRHTSAPWVKSIELTSDPAKGANSDTYGEGDEIELTVTFNYDVTVTGDPEFIIALAAQQNRSMVYQADRSTSNTMVFTYTVVGADMSSGIRIGGQTTTGNQTLKLDSDDTIKRTSNGDLEADLQFRDVGTFEDHKVDGSL